MATRAQGTSRLIPGRTYTWSELGARFDFKPKYLGVAGGMMPRPQLDALLLVTWPGGARSFNYDDYWSRGDLIYTGRGKRGDQRLEGANRALGAASQALGHSDLSTTAAIYGHYDLSDLERAMEALARARRADDEPAE